VRRPFRFGLHFWELPIDGWRERVKRYEQLGFSNVTFTDHVVVPRWEPLTALAALAAVTDRIGLGTLVLDVALRNPVVTAKSAATVERISGGRLELGLGAGYVKANFAAAGVPVLEFIAAGGLLRNEPLMRCYADVIGMPISVIGSDQGPALGSALHAAVAAGVHADIYAAAAAMGRVRRDVYEPDPERARAYDELYAIYDSLHDHFGVRRRDLMRELMAIRERGAAVPA